MYHILKKVFHIRKHASGKEIQLFSQLLFAGDDLILRGRHAEAGSEAAVEGGT